MIREEEKVQKPVYFANRALCGAEERFLPMEKLAFALVTATMSNLDAAGRLALWAIELSKFDIQYHPRITIKGQVFADFIAEFTHDKDKEVEEPSQ